MVQYPAIFFCFEDNPNDKAEAPNKIYLDKNEPTVADFAAALKGVFKINDQLSFRLGDEATVFGDDSMVLAPVNDRNRVIFVRVGAHHEAPEPGGIIAYYTYYLIFSSDYNIEPWLQKEGVDAEVIRIMKDNRITTANLKSLTDESLSKMGVGHWVARTQVLDAIKKYDTANTLVAPIQATSAGAVIDVTEKRKLEESFDDTAESPPPANKRFKMGRNKQIKIKVKDVDVLVHCEKMPIKMGMSVYTGSASNNPAGHVVGTIVQHRDKAAIEYVINGETRYGNISKFYRDVTGDPLQEKGTSWSNIFFKDNDGQVYTLESLKYIIYGPKRPVSAFLYFSNEARIKHKDLKPDVFARTAGELWRKLSNEEKEPYRVLEDQDKSRFTRERTDWEALLAKYNLNNITAPQPHPQHTPQHVAHPQLTHPQHAQQLAHAHAQQLTHQMTHTPQLTQHAHASHVHPHAHVQQLTHPQAQPSQQQHLVNPHDSLQGPVHHDQLVEAPLVG